MSILVEKEWIFIGPLSDIFAQEWNLGTIDGNVITLHVIIQ